MVHFHTLILLDLFRLCPPPPVRYAPPVTEHVPLHSKSLCKNMACASERCKYYAPAKLGGGGTNGKDPAFIYENKKRGLKKLHLNKINISGPSKGNHFCLLCK